MRKLIYILIGIIISNISYSQVQYEFDKKYEFNKKEIVLTKIDTAKLFHIENNGFDMFFSQKDIEKIILKDKNIGERRQELLDTIYSSTKIIKLKLNTIYDVIHKKEVGDAIEYGIFASNLDIRDRMNYEIKGIIVKLLLNGKFLLKKQRKNKYLTRNIIAKKVVGPWSSMTIEFKYKRKTFFERTVIWGY